jgi:hypothetical protein
MTNFGGDERTVPADLWAANHPILPRSRDYRATLSAYRVASGHGAEKLGSWRGVTSDADLPSALI